MIKIASEPLSKSYVAPVTNRSFLISYFCYIMILVIPATILINIQYSWPQYRRTLINPSILYQAYQITCLTNSNKLLYNSNFEASSENKNMLTLLTVGTQGKKLLVQGIVYSNDIKSCSSQIYLKAKLGSSVETTVHLPLSFKTDIDSLSLNKVQIKGTLSLKSSKPLPQSAIVSINQTYFGGYPYSFSSNFRQSGAKTIVLDSKILYYKPDIRALPSAFTFSAQYSIDSQVYEVQESLIQKLRAFIPIFMYISLFLWWVLINPLIDWMIKNKVYSAKLIFQKIKNQ